jgi:hypothetical protein
VVVRATYPRLAFPHGVVQGAHDHFRLSESPGHGDLTVLAELSTGLVSSPPLTDRMDVPSIRFERERGRFSAFPSSGQNRTLRKPGCDGAAARARLTKPWRELRKQPRRERRTSDHAYRKEAHEKDRGTSARDGGVRARLGSDCRCSRTARMRGRSCRGHAERIYHRAREYLPRRVALAAEMRGRRGGLRGPPRLWCFDGGRIRAPSAPVRPSLTQCPEMERTGIEPVTSGLQSRRSPS